MAITNPQAVAFSNNYARRAADLLAKAYYFAKLAKQEWDGTSMSALIPNDTQVVRDTASPTDDNGTGGDGRLVVTGAKVTTIITRCNELITDMEASSNAKLNTILQVAVNPEP